MKKLITLSLTFLFIGLFQASATHVMGSDVYYKCLGNNKYKITIKAYRDCTGVALNGLSGKITCGTNTMNISYTKRSVKDITPTCASSVSACGNQTTTGIGVEEHTFETTIDFSKAPYSTWIKNGCCEFRFSYRQCCRNGEITTGFANSWFYADAMINMCNINKTQKKCNDAPVLTSDPIAFLCCNQPFYFNNGALDNADFDSLSYELVNPQGNFKSNLSHNSPFDAKHPMTPYCPAGGVTCTPKPNAKPPRGFYLDKYNGDIVFTPTKCDEVGIVVIQIKEWRKDSTGKWLHIGTTRRDMQMIVQNCGSNDPPILSGTQSHTICEGDKLCFSIKGTDLPPPSNPNGRKDTVSMKWNNGISGATFKIKNPKAREKEAEFCWQTKVGDAKDVPYTFTVTAQDDNCPLKATSIKGFSVRVLPKAKATRKLNLLDCGAFRVQSETSVNFNGPATYKWEVRDSADKGFPIYTSERKIDTFQFTKGGKYIVTHIINNKFNCSNVYKDTIIIPPLLDVKLAIGDTFVCAGTNLKLEPKVLNGISPFKFYWKTPNAFNPADTLSYFDISPTTDTTVKLVIQDNNSCWDSTITKIILKDNPIVNIGPDVTLCTYETVTLDAQHGDTMNYMWSPNGDTTREITVNVAGEYVAEVMDTLGCIGRDTMTLVVNDTVVANAGPDQNICNLDTLKINAGGLPGSGIDAGYYEWTDLMTNTILGGNSEQDLTPNTDRCYKLYLSITQNNHTCEDIDTTCVVVSPLPVLNVKTLPKFCYDYGDINLTGQTEADPVDMTFWSKVPGFVEKRGQNYWVSPDKPRKENIYYEYTNPITKCFNMDSFELEIQPNPTISLTKGTYCQDKGTVDLSKEMVLLPNAGNRAGGKETWEIISPSPKIGWLTQNNGIWTFNTGTSSDRIGKYTLTYTFEDFVTGCRTTDTTTIDVVEVPKIEFLPLPGQCVNWDTMDLNDYVNLDNGWWTVISVNSDRTGDYSEYISQNSLFDPGRSGLKQGAFYEVRFDHTISGCPTQDSTVFVLNSLPKLTHPPIPVLCNTEDPYLLQGKVNGQNKTGIVWEGTHVTGNTFNPGLVGSDTADDITGPYSLQYSYTNPTTLCADTNTVDVSVQAQPTVTIDPLTNGALCENQDFDISAVTSHDSGIVWTTSGDGTFDDATSLNAKYTPGTNDNNNKGATLTITTLNYGPACPSVTASVPVVIHPMPYVDFGDPMSGCAPLTADFYYKENPDPSAPVLNNLAFEWDFGNGKSSSDEDPNGIIYDQEGSYDVKLKVMNMDVTDGSCANELTKQSYVHVHPVPVADFTSDPESYTTIALPEFRFTNHSAITNGNLNYEWNFDLNGVTTLDPAERTSTEKDPVIDYGSDTASPCIQLIVRSDSGCTDEIVKCVKIGPDVTVFIPNAFTPNESGPFETNTFWVSVQGHVGFNLQVFNRWGEQVFESDKATEPAFGWDGNYKEELAQMDAYMYVCTVIGFDGETYEYKGSVTLLR
jgi:gliding motility-associated-like protein